MNTTVTSTIPPATSTDEDPDNHNPPVYKDQTDDEFEAWILEEMKQENMQLFKQYPNVFERVAWSILQWRRRYHGNIPLWNRIFKKDRVIKEAMESVPVIHAVDQWMTGKEDVTIIDLCSGKGYLSMILSEYLDEPKRVNKCILIDKAWPLNNMTPKSHHINWDHIYGDVDTEDPKFDYYSTWPIPLVTSKQDLKQSITLRQLQERYSGDDQGPILILAIHLCGTLSTQAINLFHMLPKAKGLFLKPCCLPGIFYEKRQEFFELGNYQFPTKDVCASGKWKSSKKVEGRWKGPPRWHLEGKFHKWCHHLEKGIQSVDSTAASAESKVNGEKSTNDENSKMDKAAAKEDTNHTSEPIMKTQLLKIPVQTKGGYQNSFLFAEKGPFSKTMWDDLVQREKDLEASQQHQEEQHQEENQQEAPLKKKLKESDCSTTQPTA